jgi:hypothetical protein
LRINDAIVLLEAGLLPSQTAIFRFFGACSELVERIAVRIELAQGYIKARQAALPLITPIESYGALPL